MRSDATRMGPGRSHWLATGGLIGAVLASSCCVVPLVLVTLGVSGAWIGSLTALEPYKLFFVLVTLALLAGASGTSIVGASPIVSKAAIAPVRSRRASPCRCYGPRRSSSCSP
ncbi:mercuric transporter MerT family protein [Hankyongella ginsenosidimutans]|uniref:mercuric transporter MerT family protein n=1 Tax=Hankyongella ginsenosidimutans TaxID=1763828 RepID=UPI001CA31168|nr:mercuric transporter MerT family protein [Hankyongella ginsenosidimutans]